MAKTDSLYKNNIGLNQDLRISPELARFISPSVAHAIGRGE